MGITKTVITELTMPYAVSTFKYHHSQVIVVASEGKGPCTAYAADNLQPELIWDNAGGTMNICQIAGTESFLAVQGFYKGFNASTACIVKAIRNNVGNWQVERYIELPYVHRFCIIPVQDRNFVLASTLCDSKDFKDDWSKPGRVYLGELPKDLTQPCEVKPILSGITKNHGMCVSELDGRKVVLVTGMEGIFAFTIPDTADGVWNYHQVIEREVSDVAVGDIDDDGEDELITIEKFHGSRMTINKRMQGKWEIVYSFPVAFGHVVWCGKIFGKPSLLLGYRDDNGALLFMQKKAGPEYAMDITMIDENGSPCNITTLAEANKFQIFATNGRTQQLVRYEIKPD